MMRLPSRSATIPRGCLSGVSTPCRPVARNRPMTVSMTCAWLTALPSKLATKRLITGRRCRRRVFADSGADMHNSYSHRRRRPDTTRAPNRVRGHTLLGGPPLPIELRARGSRHDPFAELVKDPIVADRRANQDALILALGGLGSYSLANSLESQDLVY